MVALALWYIPSVWAQGADSATLPTPRWLVDLARDYGLNHRGQQQPSDVLHAETLLRAALRLDPRLSDAHRLLYELDSLAGRTDEANRHLAAMVEIDPDDQTAFLSYLQSDVAGAKTVEQRRAWLRGLLSAQISAVNRAMIHVELAHLAAARLDRSAAEEHLAEARRLAPNLPDLPVLALELLSAEAPPAQRLTALLDALRANPLRVELAWRIGRLLDQHGLPEQAHTFYEHALSVNRATLPPTPVPPVYLRQLSRNAFARGDRNAASEYAKRAAAADRETYTSSFYLWWALKATGQKAQADQLREQLTERFDAIRDPERQPVGLIAPAAWFYCVIDPQPERALLLAEAAAKRQPDDPFVDLVLGWALAENGQTDAARRRLASLARNDADAAYMLARIEQAAGNTERAAAIIRELRKLPVAGPERDRIRSLGLVPIASQPSSQAAPELRGVLEKFDRAPLAFPQAPWRALEAHIRLIDLSPGVGEPWWAEFELVNKAPYPISLGPDQMVNPVFLLSFELEGDKPRRYDALFTVSVDRVRVLAPGQRVSVRQTLAIGPLRKVSRRTPQQLQRVTVVAILDPQQQLDGGWQPSVAGQQLHRVSFNRMPAGTSRADWHRLFSSIESSQRGPRFWGLDVVASLLAEAQYARLGRLTYHPQPVPVSRLRDTLVSALRSDAWETRVRALEALQITGFDRPMLEAAESCLEADHWLVRLMAVRLLGERLGARFGDRAERMARTDPDALVRDMARSYTHRVSPTASQPAQTDGGR